MDGHCTCSEHDQVLIYKLFGPHGWPWKIQHMGPNLYETCVYIYIQYSSETGSLIQSTVCRAGYDSPARKSF